MRGRRALFLGGWLAVSSCRTELGRAVRAYDEARYPHAVESLRTLEPPRTGSSAGLRARYALYRGLSELAVGNARVAEAWLLRAWQAADATPDALNREDHGRLVAAWRSLGRMPAER
jgi:hypothetical protein